METSCTTLFSYKLLYNRTRQLITEEKNATRILNNWAKGKKMAKKYIFIFGSWCVKSNLIFVFNFAVAVASSFSLSFSCDLIYVWIDIARVCFANVIHLVWLQAWTSIPLHYTSLHRWLPWMVRCYFMFCCHCFVVVVVSAWCLKRQFLYAWFVYWITV